jgi:hypothetical protein
MATVKRNFRPDSSDPRQGSREYFEYGNEASVLANGRQIIEYLSEVVSHITWFKAQQV